MCPGDPGTLRLRTPPCFSDKPSQGRNWLEKECVLITQNRCMRRFIFSFLFCQMYLFLNPFYLSFSCWDTLSSSPYLYLSRLPSLISPLISLLPSLSLHTSLSSLSRLPLPVTNSRTGMWLWGRAAQLPIYQTCLCSEAVFIPMILYWPMQADGLSSPDLLLCCICYPVLLPQLLYNLLRTDTSKTQAGQHLFWNKLTRFCQTEEIKTPSAELARTHSSSSGRQYLKKSFVNSKKAIYHQMSSILFV